MARPRSRNRYTWSSHGKLSNPDQTILSVSYFHTLEEVCEDAVGSRQQANHFSLERLVRKPSYLNGSYFYFGIPLRCEEYADTRMQTESAPHAMDGIVFDPLGGATAVLGRTNPNRQSLPLSMFGQDLADLPRQIKDLGSNLLQQWKDRRLPAGSQWRKPPPNAQDTYLSWQFGWLPLIEDVKNLVKLTELTDKRVAELKGLQDKRGLRRTYRISTGVNHGITVVDLQTLLMVVSAIRSTQTSHKTWGSVVWRPIVPDALPKGDAKQRKLARNLILGLNADSAGQAKAVWDLLPWTWLFDWFGSMGNYLAAHGNQVPLIYQNLCYMQEVETVVRLDPLSGIPDGVTGGGGTVYRSSKSRTPVQGPALTASLPVFSGGQLTTLLALGRQRTPL